MQVLFQYDPIVSLATAIATNISNDTLSPLMPDNHPNDSSRSLVFTVLIACCLTIIIILTILGNILVLIALYINFALRSPTHLLMGNLACADLLLGITVLPFSGTLEILQGQWLFGRTFCHIWLAIDVLYCTASIYGLMFISIERYVGVTRPLRYPILITHRRTIYAIFTAWLVAALVSIAPFLGRQSKINSIDHTCEVNDDLSYVLFSCSFSFYIPLIIILCVYGRIYGEASRQYQFLTGGEKKVRLTETVGQESVTLRIHLPKRLSKPPALINGHGAKSAANGKDLATQMTTTGSTKFSRLKRERKAAKTLGIVVGMFILCWLPFFLLLPIKSLTSIDTGALFSICFWLGYCNSCFNPFIYAFSSREFRKAFKAILKCQRIQQYTPSITLYRISASVNDPLRSHRAHHSERKTRASIVKTDPVTSDRSSNDSQRKSFSSRSQRYFTETSSHRTSEQQTTKIDAKPRSSSSSNESSPWHMQKSPHVR